MELARVWSCNDCSCTSDAFNLIIFYPNPYYLIIHLAKIIIVYIAP